MTTKTQFELTGFRGIVRVTSSKTKTVKLFKVYVAGPDDFATGETLIAHADGSDPSRARFVNFGFINHKDSEAIVSIFAKRADNDKFHAYKSALETPHPGLKYEVLS